MSYLKSFVKKEDGIETIEFIGLCAVAAVLIGIVVKIGTTMANTATDAQSDLTSSLNDLKTIGGGNGGE